MMTPNPLQPLARQELTRRRGVTTTSRQASGMYLAIGAPSLGHRGVIIGRERYGGKAFLFDPFLLYGSDMRVRLPAPHMLVLGKSGHGKSSLVKSYVLRQMAFRNRAFCVLDAQGEGQSGEWEDIARALGVTPIRLTYGGAAGGGARINPLDPAIPAEHQHDVLASMVEIIHGAPLTSDATFALEVALQAGRQIAADQGRVPVLSDVFSAVTAPEPAMLGERRCSAEELVEWGMPAAFALQRLTAGHLAGLFDGLTGDIDLTGKLVIIDLTRLPREGVPMPLFLSVIGAWLRWGWVDPTSQIRYTLVIEEAWYILSWRPVARLFNELMRFGRRLGVAVIAVAHHLSDLRIDDVPEAMSIIKLSATRVVYHVEGDDADTIAAYLELPRWATAAIKDPAALCAPGNAIWSFAGVTQLVQHLRTSIELGLTNTNKRMTETRADSPLPPGDVPAPPADAARQDRQP